MMNGRAFVTRLGAVPAVPIGAAAQHPARLRRVGLSSAISLYGAQIKPCLSVFHDRRQRETR